MKIMQWILLGVCIIVGIILGIVKSYEYSRNIDSWIGRAQVAGNRDDMLKYIERLKKNLKERRMTEGHFAVIFKTSMNDMVLHLESINSWVSRLESIKDKPMNDLAYITTMSDIWGAIRELPNPGQAWAWVHYWFWFLMGILIWFIVNIFICLGDIIDFVRMF